LFMALEELTLQTYTKALANLNCELLLSKQNVSSSFYA
jgi:hypothetical protein